MKSLKKLTQSGAIYVTKMKKNLRYSLISDTMVQGAEGLMLKLRPIGLRLAEDNLLQA